MKPQPKLSKEERAMQENPLWLRAKLEEVTSQREQFKKELEQALGREQALEVKLAAATQSLQEAASVMHEAAQAEVENGDDSASLQAEVQPPNGARLHQISHCVAVRG